MSIKSNRTLSIFLITCIYIIASASGILLYRSLHYSFWVNLLISDIFSTVIVFFFSVILKNASVYDPYWSVQPMVILAAYLPGTEISFEKTIVVIAVFIWGVRLTANWCYTFHGLNYQDWRYTTLSEKTGSFYPIINFIGIHLIPTLIVYCCIIPAVFLLNYETEFNLFSLLFVLVSLCATLMQGIADLQMHKFRKSGKGGFIRTGLWKYSRHPNYLGEILMWWGVALYAVSIMPGSWYLITGAAANTLLFLFVSIPLADNHQSLKPGFEQYKQQTRMLLPIKR